MRLRTLSHIADVPAAAWDGLFDAESQPCLRHAFLDTLERTGAVGGDTGWTAAHRIADADDGALLAGAPCYVKQHSYGEFVFDWAWANALHELGRPYYPKLVAAIPFTPVPGPRILGRDPAARDALIDALQQTCDDGEASSAHILFTDCDEPPADDWLERHDVRYVWHNQEPEPYNDFDDFLGALSSKRRKEIRRERRRVAEQAISFETRFGETLTEAEWAAVDACYARTYAVRGQAPYLGAAFFPTLAAQCPNTVVVFCAKWRGEIVAAALALQGSDTLFGRHWGCRADLHSLHFETCYYQGIEHCILNGLRCYDAGVQGAQKLSRGFDAVMSQSAHYIAEPRLRAAVGDFLRRERQQIAAMLDDARSHSAYRKSGGKGG